MKNDVYSEKLIELENTKNEILNELRVVEKEFYSSLSDESLNKVSDAYKRLHEVDRLYRQELEAVKERNRIANRLNSAINWLKQYNEYKTGYLRQIYFTKTDYISQIQFTGSYEPTESVYSECGIEIRFSLDGYVDILGLTDEEIEIVKRTFGLDDATITKRPA